MYLCSFLILLILKVAICHDLPSIAIIGGGIGGAATSHFLTELFNNNVQIDLYEAKALGGRLATIEIDDNEYETGGSIIHPQNKYMQDFAKLLGLEHRPSSNERAGIWNGSEFVFEESKWEVISLMKLLYRYGIQPFSLNRYIDSILEDFSKIYALQDAGKFFQNVTGLLAAMNNDFPQLLNVSVRSHFLKLGYSEQFINEIIKAPLVVNYGQDLDIHSFVGCVALAGAGYNLWSVKGGNKKVAEHLIYRNKNVNVYSSCVTKIVNIPMEGGKNYYELHSHNKDSSTIIKSTYDVVIIATPITRDQQFPIAFEGFPDVDFHGMGKYHETIATFVEADLKPNYFGLEEELDAIISCEPNKTIINSVSKLNSVNGITKRSRVHKIFSNAPLKSPLMREMFSNMNKVEEIVWKAYPEYSTGIPETKFKLHDNLYYVNAIEWAASAMEMSAISGRNIALLVHANYLQKCNFKNIKIMQSCGISQNTPSNEL